jgi:hypothetical protein
VKGTGKHGKTLHRNDSKVTRAQFCRQVEAVDALMVLAAGAHVVCRGNDVSRDWAFALEENVWRDIERDMWGKE